MNNNEQVQFNRVNNLTYQLHPQIAQLNMALIHQSPYNALKFMSNWCLHKLQLQQTVQYDSQQQTHQTNPIPISYSPLKRYNQSPSKKHNNKKNIKRRKAVIYHKQLMEQNKHNQINWKAINKNQEAISRLMITIKNSIFFQRLTWEQVNQLVHKGQLYQTLQDNLAILNPDDLMQNYYIVVSGQVHKTSKSKVTEKIFYAGQSFSSQSFLFSTNSQHCYICACAQSEICIFSGLMISTFLQQITKQSYNFYQSCLTTLPQLSYLDSSQKQKLILCFKQQKDIMNGQIIFKEKQNQNHFWTNRLYLVVKGQFLQIRTNIMGEQVQNKTYKRGQFFGIQSFYKDYRTTYTVICNQDHSQLAYIQQTNLQMAIDTYDRIANRGKRQLKSLIF